MLTYDPKKRYSAQQALNHIWIKDHCQQKFDQDFTVELLNNMRTFQTQHKLQEAALTYIASQLATNQEKEKLQNTFIMLDLNGDGRLSTEELISAFRQFFDPDFPAEQEVANIMLRLDIDNNGFIDYTEFLLATINKKRLLSKERLMLAFAAFDKVRNK